MPKTACLEIHQINVSQGDSTLIINRDLDKVKAALQAASVTVPANKIDWVPVAVCKKVSLFGTVKKALLIDAGDDHFGGNVIAYLTTQGVLDGKSKWFPDLTLMVSHYHDDHMAGLRSVFKERIVPKKKRERVKYQDRLRPGVVYQSLRYEKMDPKTKRFKNFQQDLVEATTTGDKDRRTKLIEINPGGLDGKKKPTVIELGLGYKDIPITVKVVASGQSAYNPSSGVKEIAGLSRTPDQNDRSIAAMLEYGSFRYFFGGDMAGNGVEAGGNKGANAMDASTKKATSRHADVETTLEPALEAHFPATATPYKANTPKFATSGYATVMKANHHGSNSSDDVHLFATLQPAVFLLSSGVKARFHRHPTQEVLNRATKTTTSDWGCHATPTKKADSVTVKNSIKQIYITEMADEVKGKRFTVNAYTAKIMGDIIMRPIDETVNAVQQATAKGATLTVQVYGTGVQTKLSDPRSTLREPMVQDEEYPIGPWEHSDTH